MIVCCLVANGSTRFVASNTTQRISGTPPAARRVAVSTMASIHATMNGMRLTMNGLDYDRVQLKYRAEGNANLVIALPQIAKVLRLPKVNVNAENSSASKQYEDVDVRPIDSRQPDAQAKFSWNCYGRSDAGAAATESVGRTRLNTLASASNDITMADYAAYIDVMRRLVGDEFVCRPELIEIAGEAQRVWINETIRPFRPAQRLNGEFRGQFGLLLPDAVLLPEEDFNSCPGVQPTAPPPPPAAAVDTIAIEIKPKQGWPLSTDVQDLFPLQLSPNNGATRCRYCAMQYLKVETRKITRRSVYCPLDLFSGKPSRMLVAIAALLECPQNNLRIFRNGNLIYGDHASSISRAELDHLFLGIGMDVIKQVVVACLLQNFGKETPLAEDTPSDMEMQCMSLPRNCVLSKIMRLQLLVKRNLHYLAGSEWARTTTRGYTTLRSLLANDPQPSVEHFTPCQQYMIGATCLDCSVMITFRPIRRAKDATMTRHPSSFIIELPESKSTFAAKVTLLDLDPKPDNHVRNYMHLTTEALQCSHSSHAD